MHPPPSEVHGMRSLYGIGRQSWDREMSSPALARLNSSHVVGVYSIFRSVAPRWLIFGPSRERSDCYCSCACACACVCVCLMMLACGCGCARNAVVIVNCMNCRTCLWNASGKRAGKCQVVTEIPSKLQLCCSHVRTIQCGTW